jgi:hypothetical protein
VSLSEVLKHYNWKSLRPGENDKTFKFSGGGICLLVRETGPNTFAPVSILAADNDALAVAKDMLAHPRKEKGYHFAMLTALDTLSKRMQALNELGPHCEQKP